MKIVTGETTGGTACCESWTPKLVWNLAFGYSDHLDNEGGLQLCIIAFAKIWAIWMSCSRFFEPNLF